MKSERPRHTAERPWSVPLALTDVSETGRHLELAADAQTRDAIARLAGLHALPRLTAVFDVTLRGHEGLRVSGRVSATVGQICVVTLEPIENEIKEEVDLVLLPEAALPSFQHGSEVSTEDPPEALVNGSVDLGVLATEFLSLGIDPYPRRADAAFEAPVKAGEDTTHPFAALAALKKQQGG